MLTPELAAEIVQETMERLDRNINIMDLTGTIIASGDAGRIGQYHEAAAEAMRQNRELIVEEHHVPQWNGAHIGINLPVHYNGRVVGAIGITGTPNEVKPFGHLVKMTTELMIKQKHLKLQDEWKQMTVDLIVEELLQSSAPDLPMIDQRLETLHCRFSPPYQVAAAAYKLPSENKGNEGLLAKVQRMFQSDKALISQYRPQKLLFLFYEIPPEGVEHKLVKLTELLEREALKHTIGVGSPVMTREAIRLGFTEADLALRMGESEDRPLVRFDTVEAKALVHEIPSEHRNRLLTKIQPYWNDKMRETLQAFFDCSLSIASSAKMLNIHRNTMIYRLEQIKALTGYDPQQFQDAVLLQFVLWFRPESFHMELNKGSSSD
ncbi:MULTISPECIES: CdaR family transcriptional regulator [Paenibacillus]|uniref:Carbohydrate diacid transcriptional activator CdaR n=1 Tax=Paenibacillus naphthalenovorans TaxID=162209 RepID=A0A0U2W0E0_9BACL|nr:MULTISPECIES: sugar diacid recognition domain-containing protein [Paenibacillus]ALS20845.1 carbohydrate diacid transcriptional activator CdaR [Paenibacillus naphthalenovorans]GCL70876.1 hypothetical protein PN4B1_07790 [Paenibacillus naphthalenovorans]